MRYDFKGFQDCEELHESQYDVIAILKSLRISGAAINGTWVNFCCPFHNDKNPSSGIQIKTGIFSCYVCGSKSLHHFVKDYQEKSDDEVEEWMSTFLTKYTESTSLKSLQCALESVTMSASPSRQASQNIDFSVWVRESLRKKLDFEEVEELLEQYDVLRLSGDEEAVNQFVDELGEISGR